MVPAARFRPGPAEVGERIDVALARRWGVARAAAQAALRAGRVTVSGASVRPSYRLLEGDEVEGDVEASSAAPPAAEPIPVRVRHEDARLLVVAKPAGLVTHPAGGHRSGTLVNALLGLGVPLAGEGSARPGIVHRLDKDTSGLLLVAKDDAAHAFLTEALKRREVERLYLAVVVGTMPAASGTIEAPLGRHPARRSLVAVVAGGRPAVTHYLVLDSNAGLTLLEVRLETGRTHQIRAHLAHLGHPVLGDRSYGGATQAARSLGLTRSFLHAYRLRAPHPDGGVIEVEDDLPDDLAGALDSAGLALPRDGGGPARPDTAL